MKTRIAIAIFLLFPFHSAHALFASNEIATIDSFISKTTKEKTVFFALRAMPDYKPSQQLTHFQFVCEKGEISYVGFFPGLYSPTYRSNEIVPVAYKFDFQSGKPKVTNFIYNDAGILFNFEEEFIHELFNLSLDASAQGGVLEMYANNANEVAYFRYHLPEVQIALLDFQSRCDNW